LNRISVSAPSISTQLAVSAHLHSTISNKHIEHFIGGESDALTFGNDWIVNHGVICTSVGKPCILEEYGDNSNLTLLLTWQTAALNTVGIAGDLFWQYGDTLSFGETPQDGNTIYYNSSAYEQVVTEHIQRIVTSYYELIDR
jgi:mannan endo-1,4-beta-mannosidase